MAVFTINEFTGYMKKLPARFNKMDEEVIEVARASFQARIRRQAPPGSLKGIEARRSKQGFTVWGPGHAGFVNKGVNPDGPIPIDVIQMNDENPGMTAGRKLKTFIPNPTGFFYPTYTGGKGFITRAKHSFDKDFKRIQEKAFKKAVKK